MSSEVSIAPTETPLASIGVKRRIGVKSKNKHSEMKEIGRGGGDRKQYRTEFQGLRGNAKERQGIEKEQSGTRRHPYWPLNGPSFSPDTEIPSLCFLSLFERCGQLRPKFCSADGKLTTRLYLLLHKSDRRLFLIEKGVEAEVMSSGHGSPIPYSICARRQVW